MILPPSLPASFLPPSGRFCRWSSLILPWNYTRRSRCTTLRDTPHRHFHPFLLFYLKVKRCAAGKGARNSLIVPFIAFFFFFFLVGGRREEGWRRKMRPNRCRYGGEDFWSKTSGFLCSSLSSPTCSVCAAPVTGSLVLPGPWFGAGTI